MNWNVFSGFLLFILASVVFVLVLDAIRKLFAIFMGEGWALIAIFACVVVLFAFLAGHFAAVYA